MWADLRHRVTWFWRRRDVEAELADELRDHLDCETEKRVRAGLSRTEARRQAALALGGIEQAREDVRDAYGTRAFEDVWRDVLLACRGLRRQKRLTAALILTMALGVGANTAIADVIDEILWRPLSVANPDEIVSMYGIDRSTARYQGVSYPDFTGLTTDIAVFGALAAYDRLTMRVSAGGQPQAIRAEAVTEDYFAVLSAPPLAGRVLGPADQRDPGVAVISERLWRRLSSDAAPADAVGQTIHLGQRDVVVVGVMPAIYGTEHDLTWGPAPEVWVPLSTVASDRTLHEPDIAVLAVLARLRPDATLSTAQAAVDRWASRLGRDGRTVPAPAFKLLPAAQSKFWPANGPAFVRTLAMLGTVATLVLLLACVNITNLLLQQSVRRHRELAVRASLGASRSRLVRQLLIEPLVLAAPAFVAALIVARLLQGVMTTFPQALGMALTVHLHLTARELLFCAIVTIAAAVGTSVVPAVRATRRDVLARLRDDRGRPGRRRAPWLGQMLVAAEVAITAVLLLVSLLMTRSVLAAYSAPLGYDAAHLVDLALAPRPASSARTPIPDEALRREAWDGSGVAGAALSITSPLQFSYNRGDVRRAGEATAVPQIALEQHVSPGFFSTLQIPLLSGAAFGDADATSERPVAVVNATLARRLWGTEPAVGRAVELLHWATPSLRLEVVGVVPDLKWRSIDEAPMPYLYRPIAGSSPLARHVILRTTGPAAAALPDVVRAWSRVAPAAPIARVSTGTDLIHEAVGTQRLTGTFVGTFAALAMIVAGIGIYSAVAWSVERRSREIALRIALGGSPGRVGGRVLGRAIAMACAGAAAGLAAGVTIASRVLVLDPGVGAADPAAMAAAATVLSGAAVLAAVLPARRAAGIDPLPLLKGD